ncbi:MAG TPA: BMP family ABC transporter substrate-binding protein [Nocardioidaceae bacterium]|nr:BMP family ABC transporter substrate-binding protein [Nocardioidaceae bacterium]
MRRLTKIAAVTAVVALSVTGCAKKETGTSTGTAAGGDKGALCASGGEGPKIGLAYDIGGRGDKSFNDLAAAGTKKVSEEIDATCKESEAATDEPDSAKEERLRTLADAGYDPIVAVGFVYTPMVTKVAKEYPDLKFAVVDGAAEGNNVTNLSFAPEQGSYLVGIAAGLKTKTNKVGFVGGVKGPIIDPFAAGFQAGVKEANPKATVEMKWLSDQADGKAFANPPGGKTAATALYDGGADIVFHASGLSGNGVFEAAATAKKLAIGVDSDQYLSAPKAQQQYILTSALKRVDVAVSDFVTAYNDKSVKPGFDVYDMKRDGVGYATSGGQVDDIKTQIDEYKAKVISGEIKVPKEL